MKTITCLLQNLTHINVDQRTFIPYDIAKGQGHYLVALRYP